jgi:GMP synthase-like glutamine amidotransferase
MSTEFSALVLVCQPEDAWETYNIADDKQRIAEALGWPPTTPRLRAISAIHEALPDEFPEAAVVICGSRHMLSENLPWMSAAKDFVRRVYRQGKPMLGLCFGHQLVCDALGGAVGQSDRPEQGMVEVALTNQGMNDPLLRALTLRSR